MKNQSNSVPIVLNNDVLSFNESTPLHIIPGDARTVLHQIPSNFVQSCITSPPYWGLRDYGIKNQIGAEKELDHYIENLVTVFREVRRVLKANGTLWLNIGDSYTSGNRTWRAPDKKNPGRAMSYRPQTPQGLKPKDLIGVPWRVVFALQKDGWYLRSDIIWYKPNCQPESVRDRPTKAHEYVFLLSKSEDYLYDYESVLEPALNGDVRNRRSVWSINTEGFRGAHFAVFPTELVRLCILSSTRHGSIVLDPFLGTGTVGATSLQTGRYCLGIELNEEYVKLAERRIPETAVHLQSPLQIATPRVQHRDLFSIA